MLKPSLLLSIRVANGPREPSAATTDPQGP